MRNLVDLVQLELQDDFSSLGRLVQAVDGLLRDSPSPSAELFLFTDNSVAEGAFYRGTSSNPRLFDLVLRLRSLEMHSSLRLHVVHVSGERMVAQGTDGLSRSDLDVGVMGGTCMLSFVPLHIGALIRSPPVLDWVQSWCPAYTLQPLKPIEWSTVGQGITGYYSNADGVTMPDSQVGSGLALVWALPPSAAEYALEELSLSRHKRPTIRHIFSSLACYSHFIIRLHGPSTVPLTFLRWTPASELVGRPQRTTPSS